MDHLVVFPFYLEVAAIVLAIAAAGIGRALVGAGTLSRGIVYPVVAGFAAFVGFGASWWALPFAIVPALTLWLGFTKWEVPAYMAARYGLPAALLAFVHAWLTTLPGAAAWAIACILIGGFYGTMQARLVNRWVDSSRLAEFAAGAVIIGGVAVLRL